MKTLVCIPCMESVPTDFVRCLITLQSVGETRFAFTRSSLVYDARHILASQAIMNGFDRVLWLDSDMTFTADLLVKLSATMDETGADLVSGLYFTRKNEPKPVLFSKCRKDAFEMYDPYPKDAVFDIDGCGFGGVLMTTALLCAVGDKYQTIFAPYVGYGEDVSFCMRARETGAKMVCDSRIKLGHIGYRIITEETYEKRNETCLRK